MKRDSNIDLFRIFSMFLIVLLHVIVTNFDQHSGTVRTEIVHLFRMGAFCGVNCFALLSGYVGISATPRIKKLKKLWLQIFFYSVTGTIFSFVLEGQFALNDFFKALFPITSGRYWYMSAYFPLFFMMPLLNKAINGLEQKILFPAVVGVGILFCVVPLFHFPVSNTMGLNGGYSFTWLAYLYVIGGLLKKNSEKIKQRLAYHSFIHSFIVYLFCVLCIWGWHEAIFWILPAAHHGREFLLMTYISPLVLGNAVALLYFFSQLKISFCEKKKVWIQHIAGLTLGVYLLHTHPAFFKYVFPLIGKILNHIPSWGLPFALVCSAAVIFSFCAVIELSRQFLFERKK